MTQEAERDFKESLAGLRWCSADCDHDHGEEFLGGQRAGHTQRSDPLRISRGGPRPHQEQHHQSRGAGLSIISIQLGVCVSEIVMHDFPGKLPQIVDKIPMRLQNSDPVAESFRLIIDRLLHDMEPTVKVEASIALWTAVLLVEILILASVEAPRHTGGTHWAGKPR